MYMQMQLELGTDEFTRQDSKPNRVQTKDNLMQWRLTSDDSNYIINHHV